MPTLTINCTKDVCVSQRYPSNAYSELRFGSGSNGDSSDKYYVLLGFDSLGLSSSTVSISAATLTVTKMDGSIGYNSSFSARAVRLTSSWSESTNYSGRPGTTTSGASSSVSVGTGHSGNINFNVTSIVRAWADGSTAYGIQLEKTTSGGSLIKTIQDRTSSSRAKITVTYEYKAPAPNPPATINRPGTITTDGYTFTWSAGSDGRGLYSASQLSYELQVSTNGGSTWGSTYTTSAGVTSYALNIRSYLGLQELQAYYNTTLMYRVRTKTPSWNGTTYYSGYIASGTFTVNYRLKPSTPSSFTVSKASPYEGETITFTIGRPAVYNTHTQSGSVTSFTYSVVLANGTLLARGTASSTQSSITLSYNVGNLTSGKSDLLTSVKGYCSDGVSPSSPYTAPIGFTVMRFRAPVVTVSAIERSETSAVIRAIVTDTGYGSVQLNGQILTIKYRLGSGSYITASLLGWSGLQNSFVITGLSADSRYTLDMYTTSAAPSGTSLPTRTSAVYKRTIVEHTPAVMIYRDSSNGASGLAAKGLLVGNDWSKHVAEGDIAVQGNIFAGASYDKLVWHDGNMPCQSGAWTPLVRSSETWPTVAYTNQYGWYWRIGRMVYVKFRLRVNITAAGTGGAQIHGLPFPSASDGTAATAIQNSLTVTMSLRGLNETSPTLSLPTLHVDGGGMSVIAVRNGSGGSTQYWQVATDVYLHGAGWYVIN